MKRNWLTEAVGAASATLASIVSLAPAQAAVESRTYVDAVESLTTAAEKERWNRMISALDTEFNDVCGDSFCEGEYPEIAPIFFRCSVTRASGELRSCVWVFGESEWRLDADTGAILVVKSKVTACTLPVTGTAAALADAIHGLLDRLPGTTTSIFEELQSCL
jgi:hypothetical protein